MTIKTATKFWIGIKYIHFLIFTLKCDEITFLVNISKHEYFTMAVMEVNKYKLRVKTCHEVINFPLCIKEQKHKRYMFFGSCVLLRHE